MNYKIVKNYRKNDSLRASFNKLSDSIFGFNFEEWYSNGYWGDNYIPYSVLFNDEIIANVSVNIIDIKMPDCIQHYIQLGTVMTSEKFRNKGLIRVLMNEIEKDYNNVDGIFLFANDSVIDFYPKFGFVKAKESQYVKTVENTSDFTAEKIPMTNKCEWDSFKSVIDGSAVNSSFEMINNSDLIMFYITSFMKDCVYYIKSVDSYVIAEIEDNELLIYNIFSRKTVNIDEVIKAFGSGVKTVKCGFTPFATDGFICTDFSQEDTTLFVKGDSLLSFSDEKKMFPLLSHA